MTAYVILVGTEEGMTCPTILGPFADHETAEAYAISPQVAQWARTEQELWGGWPCITVASDRICQNPIEWLKQWSDIELEEPGVG